MQRLGGWMNGKVLQRFDLRLAPSRLRRPVHLEHVVGELLAEHQVILVRLGSG